MNRPEAIETPRELDHYTRGFFVGLSGILFLAACACVILFQKHAKLTLPRSRAKPNSSRRRLRMLSHLSQEQN
jgi:hypothetical protein